MTFDSAGTNCFVRFAASTKVLEIDVDVATEEDQAAT